ncbi:MAG: DMT family transporter [Actinomycetota bacterium]
MRSRTGYLELIVCGLVWGSIGVLVKEVDVSAPVIVFFRLALGSLSVIIVWGLRGKLADLRLSKPRGGVVAAGLILAVHWLAFIEAYKRMSVATTILVVYVGPVLIAAAAPAVLGERLERRTLYALALSIAGILLIAVPSSGEIGGIGLFFAGVAAVLFAALVLTLKKYVTPIQRAPATVAWQLGIAAVAVSPFLVVASGDEIARAAPTLLALGVIHTGLIGILYVSAIAVVQAQHVSILVYLEPVTAVLWAWAVLGESPTLATLFGGALIIAAGLLIVVPSLRGIPSPSMPEPADARVGGIR